jgi:hypothetical protein
VDTGDELLARIFDAAARNKKNAKMNSDEQHAIFAYELHTKYTEVDGGIFENLV